MTPVRVCVCVGGGQYAAMRTTWRVERAASEQRERERDGEEQESSCNKDPKTPEPKPEPRSDPGPESGP